VGQLSRAFQPRLAGLPHTMPLISGSSGVGKMVLVRHTSRLLSKSAPQLHTPTSQPRQEHRGDPLRGTPTVSVRYRRVDLKNTSVDSAYQLLRDTVEEVSTEATSRRFWLCWTYLPHSTTPCVALPVTAPIRKILLNW